MNKNEKRTDRRTDRTGEDIRKPRRRKTAKRRGGAAISILAGIAVMCWITVGLTWTVLRFLPRNSAADQPTLPGTVSASGTLSGSGQTALAAGESADAAQESSDVLSADEAGETGAAEGSSASETIADDLQSTGSEETSSAAESETDAGSDTEPAVIAVAEEETTEADLFALTDDEDYNRRLEAIEKYDNLGVVVNVAHYLNMRSGPSLDAEVCGVIFPYCGVNVLEEENNGWDLIESGGAKGYVSSKYIETGKEAVKLAAEHCRYQAYVTAEKVVVRTDPSEDSDEITSIVQGDYFDCLSEDGNWVEIEIAEDLGGYVPASSVTTGYRMEEAIVFGFDDSVSNIRKNIINTAFEYYGNKYVWGGTDLENGVDCSGFTQQIYGMFGVTLTRNSYTQVGEGKAVDEKDVKPGDLLFYYGRIPGQVGHVAIYIGNGKIIHAASEKKGICVSDWKFVPIVAIRDVIPEELDH
ncbi:MAG: NlpC/P60 family protein [Lachnospiraceae bacterium]|jgi:cell wall-associated NlpC family hydrolase